MLVSFLCVFCFVLFVFCLTMTYMYQLHESNSFIIDKALSVPIKKIMRDLTYHQILYILKKKNTFLFKDFFKIIFTWVIQLTNPFWHSFIVVRRSTVYSLNFFLKSIRLIVTTFGVNHLYHKRNLNCAMYDLTSNGASWWTKYAKKAKSCLFPHMYRRYKSMLIIP